MPSASTLPWRESQARDRGENHGENPKPNGRQGVLVDDVRRVLVLGSGTMGLQIGLQAATHGYDVVLYDSESAAVDGARGRLVCHA